MTTSAKRDTKTAILDAAESLMAEHGIQGVSLRAILSQAGANSSALHYHFNSREGLVQAILARHGLVTSLRRLELIQQIKASKKKPSAQDVVSALVDPMVELLEQQGEGGRRFIRFIARLQSDRAGVHQSEERKHFPEIWKHMEQQIARICPRLSKKERTLRVTMMIDTMLQSLANADFMTVEWQKDRRPTELLAFAGTLKDFLAGGLGAPSTRAKPVTRRNGKQ